MPVKLLFINKYDRNGGAAMAAWRLHEELSRHFGTEDRFLVGIKSVRDPLVSATRGSGWPNTLERGLNFLLNRLGLQYVYFPISTPRILKEVRCFRPDIVHLHNLHGGYFDLSLLRQLSETGPLVWTLHDMWAFTANAAHTFGDQSFLNMRPGPGEHRRFPDTGLNTGRWLLWRKKRLYSRSRLTVVCPSRWLYDLARQAPVFESVDLRHIPNGVDTRRFVPSCERSALRDRLGISDSRPVLLFSAEKPSSSQYKGGAGLLDVLQRLDRSGMDMDLLVTGKEPLQARFAHLKIRHLGFLSEETAMIAAYQAADIYVYPSRADNLPNTLMEAMACGLPCVSYDVGGCAELVQEGSTGRILPAGDAAAMTEAVLDLAADAGKRRRFAEASVSWIQEHYSLHRTAQQYYELYQQILSHDSSTIA